MRSWRTAPIFLFALAGVSGLALAQRAVHTKDTQAPEPDTSDDDTTPPPPVKLPDGGKTAAPQSNSKQPAGKGAAASDAGPYVKPTFKDDLTADEIKRGTTTAKPRDCTGIDCELIFRRRNIKRELLVHLRPARLRVGEVAEVVVEASEILDEADPEMGEKKPMEGLKPIAHLEGIGRYAMVPLTSSVGSYGFHFTPQQQDAAAGTAEPHKRKGKGSSTSAPEQPKGLLRLDIEGIGLSESFDLPVGQTVASSAGADVRFYEPRPALEPVGQQMAELGMAWGGLWAIALGTSKGDAAALTKAVRSLAKLGTTQLPNSVGGGPRSTTYVDLAKAFSELTAKLAGQSGTGLRTALSEIDDKQCNRCHAAFAWGITEDVSEWPNFKIAGAGKEEAQ